MTKKPSILVTGGAGYIGSHCCKALALAGFEPVVFDDLSSGHRAFLQWGSFVEGDIRNAAALASVFREHQPLAVLHLASLIVVADSLRDPERFRAVNVEGTRTLIESMAEAGVDKLVFSSSAAVYGDTPLDPIPEDAPLRPRSPYGETKLAAEELMARADASHGLRSIRLRYFNAAGADPSAEIGEDHAPETHLIPLVLDAALGRGAPLSVFGRDYPTPDGSAIRDYVHVNDLADAHLAALEHLLAGGESAALNLGSGEGLSVLQVIERAEALLGRPIARSFSARRVGDPARLVADPQAAKRLLAWRARRSGLDEIITDAWRWHRRRFGA